MNSKEKFEKYEELLRTWSQKMNLVAPSTLSDIKNRHIADSAQLADVIPVGTKIVDLGSGAGFPAVVLAIFGYQVTCIESIGKKTDFLNAVKKELNLNNLTIYHGRVENFLAENTGKSRDFVFTARAFAPLIKILDYVRGQKSRLFLLKGRDIESEILVAKRKYKFKYDMLPSKTGDGFVVILQTL
ncbi:MAG: 16S rRNA (guanine(527)-N(7))-methyltransferase RsmG [Alphaproteobacteria bacterium]|nr:16S rRNA (guanine(527)-N(7))-methyltransferase RsmG [Alphaproteobacteria bacterium]